jgi:hypothetical protein
MDSFSNAIGNGKKMKIIREISNSADIDKYLNITIENDVDLK